MTSPAVADLRDRCVALVEAVGLAKSAEVGAVVPLTGGVASEIATVDLPGRTICVKFALPKLKVAADWQAPVHRARAEYAWLAAAGRIAPDHVPGLLGWCDDPMGFAMERISGSDVYLWKAALLQGRPTCGEAAAVGDVLGRIHAATTAADFDRAAFRNHDDFWALRLEPYLMATASRHPALAGMLRTLADEHRRADRVLIYGDVSPKNILFRDSRPVLLDAECATMGDPAFDLAFCLNHLVLKAVHMPSLAAKRLAEARTLWVSYRKHLDWEPPETMEARAAALLPALMLARVDGKSPVEYLSDDGRAIVRRHATALLSDPPSSIDVALAQISES